MANIIEITDLAHPGLDVYARLTEAQLRSRRDPAKAVFIAGQEVASLINRKLYIPNYPPQRETTESLNVAMATGIICAEFRRRAISAG